MDKKTRDLKRHYRNVERNLRNFNIDLSEESWYRMWHIHLDWEGVTSVSVKHRKIHILYYLKIFRKINEQTKENKRDFQTWIYLDGYDGVNDALYFHTENPPMLIGLLDLSKFNIGIIKSEKENIHSYIIQKKGLGVKINTVNSNNLW